MPESLEIYVLGYNFVCLYPSTSRPVSVSIANSMLWESRVGGNITLMCWFLIPILVSNHQEPPGTTRNHQEPPGTTKKHRRSAQAPQAAEVPRAPTLLVRSMVKIGSSASTITSVPGR